MIFHWFFNDFENGTKPRAPNPTKVHLAGGSLAWRSRDGDFVPRFGAIIFSITFCQNETRIRPTAKVDRIAIYLRRGANPSPILAKSNGKYNGTKSHQSALCGGGGA